MIWAALMLALGASAAIGWAALGEWWAASGRTNRVAYVPWLPGADAINALPGLTVVHRKALAWEPWRARALVEHERVHGEQRTRIGWCQWWCLYALSVSRRVELEAEAYAANARRRAARPDRARAVVVEAYARLVRRRYRVRWWPPDWIQTPPERATIEDWIEGHLP